jgi:hypothetical protein
LHAVWPQLRQLHLRKIGHHIGLQIACRVLDFVEQLFGACSHRDAAARTRHFGDDRVTRGPDFGQRKAQPSKIGHVLVTRIGKVAASDLPGTFKQMPNQHASAQPRPVVSGPAKVVHQGCQKQRWIGDAPGDDDLRVGLQRGQQGFGAQIGVGRDQLSLQITKGLGGFEHGQSQARLRQSGQHIVAKDHRHFDFRQAQFTGNRQHRMPSLQRVGRTHVADDAGAMGKAGGQHGAHAGSQHQVIACIRVFGPLQLRQGNRALGQAFEHQIVQLALIGQLHGGRDAVTRVTCASANSDGRFVH